MSNANEVLSRIRRFLMPGLISALVLLILLLFTAALSNTVTVLQRVPAFSGKLCLTLAAVLCGLLRAKGCEKGKLAAALSGEGVLLAALLLICLLCKAPVFSLSLLIDLACMAFGGFAGVLLADRGVRRKRRKR